MPAIFPSWARIGLGLLVGLVTYFVAGDFIHIDDSARALISSLTVLLGSVGVVPPRPGDIRMSTGVALVLTAAAIVLNYVLVSVVDLEPVVRGLLAALVALASSVGITPPQARGS